MCITFTLSTKEDRNKMEKRQRFIIPKTRKLIPGSHNVPAGFWKWAIFSILTLVSCATSLVSTIIASRRREAERKKERKKGVDLLLWTLPLPPMYSAPFPCKLFSCRRDLMIFLLNSSPFSDI